MDHPNFIGAYFYSIDAKNRLAIPAKMRLALSLKDEHHSLRSSAASLSVRAERSPPDNKKELVLCRGLEGCLNLYPIDVWMELNDKLETISVKDKAEQRAFKRMLFANACEVEFDEEGRILVPQPLADYAQLQKEVAVIGLVKKIEIWSKRLWRNYEKKQQIVFKRHASSFEI